MKELRSWWGAEGITNCICGSQGVEESMGVSEGRIGLEWKQGQGVRTFLTPVVVFSLWEYCFHISCNCHYCKEWLLHPLSCCKLRDWYSIFRYYITVILSWALHPSRVYYTPMDPNVELTPVRGSHSNIQVPVDIDIWLANLITSLWPDKTRHSFCCKCG
jgi:hypothetical protein